MTDLDFGGRLVVYSFEFGGLQVLLDCYWFAADGCGCYARPLVVGQ